MSRNREFQMFLPDDLGDDASEGLKIGMTIAMA